MSAELYFKANASIELGVSPSIVHVLQDRARKQPNRLAYRFLSFGAGDDAAETAVTYAELDRNARAVAALLQESTSPGDRALLVYSAGADYLNAFFGCLYAGVVAVPAYPPEYGRLAGRLEKIASDCDTRVALTTRPLLAKCHDLWSSVPALSRLRWLGTDDKLDGLEGLWRPREATPETLAFIQYTSGSSGDPKGVMVSNGNLVDNLERLRRMFGYAAEDHHVTWLPPYHDMGLIASLLSALYAGHPCALMSPFAFLQSPWRWISEVSRQRATVIGAPNFAYDLCVRKIPAERIPELDLSGLRVAFCAAEPVRPRTLERFLRAFAPAGLRAQALRPAYGLAEATVAVSASPPNTRPRVLSVAREAYGRGRVVDAKAGEATSEAVSCGPPLSGHDVLVVDPDTRNVCPDGVIGELWIAGPSVAKGYWGKADATEETFGGRLALPSEARQHPGPFLRTGDLAFLRDGDLFIAGRLKDLIIVRGINRYPQDIELTSESSHAAMRLGCCAAFSVDGGDEEKLVVLQELVAGAHDTSAIFAAIRSAVREEHQLEVSAIVLIEANSLPKTTSGKVARRPSRAAFLTGRLRTIASWSAPS